MSIKHVGNNLIRRIFCVVFLIFSMCLQTACLESIGGFLGDWSYKLPNNYEIVRVNSQEVVFGKTEGVTLDHMIDRYIISFCFNKSYVGLKRIPLDGVELSEYIDIKTYDRSGLEYYLVDTENDIKYGPYYTEEEYLEQCSKFNVTQMCEWISTIEGKPKDATW